MVEGIELACPTIRAARSLPTGWLRDRLGTLAPAERHRLARDVIHGFAADLLGDLSKVHDDCGLDEMDMDSIMMIDLGEQLGHAMNEDLFAVVTVGYPTIRELTRHVTALVHECTARLAIVSTALRLPGGLTTPESYWKFLLDDRDVNPFVSDIAGFDPAFFGMSQREAELTDPQQRLLLETAWETFERAGIALRRGDRLDAGVFIGITRDEYSERLDHSERIRCDAAGRISRTLGLTGPAISVDTADSSSLVALHLAAQALRRGECRYALFGGASLMFSPGSVIEHHRNSALPPNDRCKPFTAAADGPGRGEGVGAVLLMRLRDAEHEGRPIQAVLRGSAVTHTGAPNAIGRNDFPVPAPDADRRRDAVYASLADACAAQQTVIRAALAEAGVAAHEVGVVETHATGSRLGDPIEVGALDEVIGTAAPRRPARALLSSLKPRLGHLDAAAGIAALIKVVLMLQHGVVPAAVPLEAGPLSEFVPWDRVRLLVPRVHTPWPIEYARRVAGVSSFGEAGTNAHAVLEAYVSTPASAKTESIPASAHPHLIALSAGNATSLTEMVVATSSYLVGTPPENLGSVAHTLQVGRTPFEHRVAVVGSSGPDLAEKLAVAVGHGNKVSTADGEASTASTPNAVTLRVGSGVVRLSSAINALTTAFPLLVPVVGATDLPPAERLKRLMLHFGLRVKSERRDPASGAAVAEVAWAAGRSLPLITDHTGATPAHLLHVLAALFTDGADLRFDVLRQTGARIVGDLPTYSFRRKRCWIDERTDGNDRQHSADRDVDHDHDHELVRAFLLSELMSVLPGGKDRKDLDPAETFIELGGDSFAAMQLTVRIEEHYGVEIPLDEFDGDLQISILINRLSRRIVRANEWTASRATRQDGDLCPPSYLDASYPPPSTPTSSVQSWTAKRPA